MSHWRTPHFRDPELAARRYGFALMVCAACAFVWLAWSVIDTIAAIIALEGL